MGIALPNAVVDLLPNTKDRASRVSDRYSAYDVVNDSLDLFASRVASAIQRGGHAAFPIPSAERVDDGSERAACSSLPVTVRECAG